eukprot:2415626-Prymnesium_polylepis.1
MPVDNQIDCSKPIIRRMLVLRGHASDDAVNYRVEVIFARRWRPRDRNQRHQACAERLPNLSHSRTVWEQLLQRPHVRAQGC